LSPKFLINNINIARRRREMKLDLAELPLNGSKMKTVSIPDGLVGVTVEFLNVQCNHLSKRPNCPRAQQQVAIFAVAEESQNKYDNHCSKGGASNKNKSNRIRSGASDSEYSLYYRERRDIMKLKYAHNSGAAILPHK
jgi:hypothetical protein